MIKSMLMAAALLAASTGAWAGKNCDELKQEIAGKLDQKGVSKYTLNIVPQAEVKAEDKVVGSCEGGAKKITYKRG